MIPPNVIELPAELAEAVKEHLARLNAAFDAPPPVLEDSAAGRDILHLVATRGRELAEGFTRFADVLGSEVYTPRVFTFRSEGRANKARWRPYRLTLASRDFLSGSVNKLRTMCDNIGGDDPNFINVWVRSAPEKGTHVFFVLLRHKDGTEAAYSVEKTEWNRIEASPDALDMILEGLLHVDKEARNRWVALLSAGAAHADDELREELLPLLKSWGVADVTGEQWNELLEALFLRQGYWDAIVDAGRHLTPPLMHEAQHLLDALTRLKSDMQEAQDRRIAQVGKEHVRAYKRLRADFDKATLSLNGAHLRNRQLAKEVALLQERTRELQQAAPSAPAAPRTDVTLAVALDQFFPQEA